MAGRIGSGLPGERLGAKRTLVAGLLLQAFAAGSYVFARKQSQFYLVVSVFGFAYAGVMPLYAVLMRESFPWRSLESGWRRVHGVQHGHGAGAAARQRDLRHIRHLGWLYFGSLLIGLGATAIMLTFRLAQPSIGTGQFQGT